LLGFFEMVQGENLTAAEQHLYTAIRLEPENESYLLTLAQVQIAQKDAAAARRTLESLRLPYVDAGLRAHAEELLDALNRQAKKDPSKK
jgi:thioredoxin-like negative regulator of GroEL